MLLTINPVSPQQRLIDRTVSILKNDGVIIYPTDTVYGLGCSIFSKKAMTRICQIKNRDPKKPMSFVCSSDSQIQEYTQGIPTHIFRIIRRYLPGPYTFIFNASKVVPQMMLTKRKTLGCRWPDQSIAIKLVETLGHPILSTSLLTSEDTLYNDATLLHEEYKKQVDLVIDGGTIFAEYSTIMDFTISPPVVVRQGKGETSWVKKIFV